MTLQKLFENAGVSPDRIHGDAEIAAMTLDSRQAGPGSLFVCQAGTERDSHEFLGPAQDRGAVAAIVHSAFGFECARSLGLAVAQLPSAKLDFNQAIWRICDAFYDHPTRSFQVIGITGTNGKTTTAWVLRDLLEAMGVPTAYLGTLGLQMPGHAQELSNTTPFAVELYGLLAKVRDSGAKALTIEISSHALAEFRADGVEFDVAVFTNLTQDHLDFHGDMASYEAAKLRLFTELPGQTQKPAAAAINLDDPAGQRFAKQASAQRVVGFGTGGELRCLRANVSVSELDLDLEYQGDLRSVRVPLGGSYNVENTLAAVAAAVALGYPFPQIVEALPKVRPVPGRFEPVPNDKGIGVLVDYAHTPDALIKLLEAVRPLTTGRVATVFGCGGDRDRKKRPLMAQAASAGSDLTVVTSDNPRTEDPQSILDEVVAGIMPGKKYVAILDRSEAIAFAIGQAQPGDVVVIAGKGHENYQIIGKTKTHMDDRELAREALL